MKKFFEEYGGLIIVAILVIALILLAVFIKNSKKVESTADVVMSEAPVSEEDAEKIENDKKSANSATKTTTVKSTNSDGSSKSTSVTYKEGQTWGQWTNSSANTVGAKIVSDGDKTYVDVSKATGSSDTYDYIEISDKNAQISDEATASKYVQVNIVNSDKSSGAVSGGGIVKQNATVHLTATAAEGREFAGWENTNGETLSSDNPYLYTASANTNIVATWQEKSATLTYNVNYDESTNQTAKITYADQLLAPEAPEREGYEFKGWNTAQDGSGTNYLQNAVIKEAKVTHLFSPFV